MTEREQILQGVPFHRFHCSAMPSLTYKVPGLNWPETLGSFTLMGPPNRLGTWRWYQRSLDLEGVKITERIKLDCQLRPIRSSLVTTRA